MNGSIIRYIAAILAVAAIPLGLMVTTASAATSHSAEASKIVAVAKPTSRVTSAPLPRASTASLHTSTVTTTSGNGKTSTSRPVRPQFFYGLCWTAWSGRYLSSSCDGIGSWRQWAQCSGLGYVYTSPWLPDPPVDFWLGSCPSGSYVISAGVQF